LGQGFPGVFIEKNAVVGGQNHHLLGRHRYSWITDIIRAAVDIPPGSTGDDGF
jgi:hypothetical protein